MEKIAFGPNQWENVPPELRENFIRHAPTWLDENRDPDGFTIDPATLSTFPAPTLLTYGETGPDIFKPVIRRLATIIPHAKVKVYAGIGHDPQKERPQEFVRTLTGFVREVSG